MKKKLQILSLALVAPFFTSCARIGPAPKSERQQIEMCLQKARSDLEEVRSDLHSQKMELHILSGKINNQTEAISGLKKEAVEVYQEKIENASLKIETLEKKFLGLEKTQGELTRSLQQISFDTYEIRKALSQGKERINELEKLLSSSLKLKTDKTIERLHSKNEPLTEQEPVN